jgi:DNA-binding CsgD family transcriptional regulator/PAS domain-containing protein
VAHFTAETDPSKAMRSRFQPADGPLEKSSGAVARPARHHLDATALVADAGVAAFSTGPTGAIRSWNARAQELLGHPQRAVLGRQMDELLEPRDIHGNRFPVSRTPYLQMVLQGDPINPFSVILRAASGERVPATASVVVVCAVRPGDHQIVYLLQRRGRRRRSDEVIDRLLSRRDWRQAVAADPAAWSARQPLTPRQLEVLRRLCAGASLDEIATSLSTSIHTVRNHLQAIFAKLRAHSRAEAVAKAYQLDLV